MTLRAPIAPPTAAHPGAESTERIEATATETVLDVVSLLDHRTRSRLVAQQLARRGPHLALEDGKRRLLLELAAKITHLGRGSAADVRFDEKRISRDHAIIVRHGRFARLLDNRSSNGTYLNGRRIVAANLADGDVIRIGGVALQYVDVA